MTSRDYFKGKRIALVGLGPHGEMVEDAKFMIKQGALLSIYDIRSEARLKNHLVFLRSLGLANYVCGSIPADDLIDMDAIVLSHEYSRESTFLKVANNAGIAVEYPETLFFRLAPPLTLVGVMGSCGKATVVSMLSPMLESVCADSEVREDRADRKKEDKLIDLDDRDGNSQRCFVADPESCQGVLTHLKKAKSGDILVMRIVEKMMREFKNMRISPQVSVFTSIPSRFAYDNSPFEILDFQTYNNFVVASDEVIDATRLYGFQPRAKMLRTKISLIPDSWEFKGRTHDRENAALALQVARLFKVADETAEWILSAWKPLKGRLELIKKVKNVEFYNDSASVSPVSTIAGMISLSENRNLVLILGGVDVGLDYRELNLILPQYAHTVILLPGSGTLKQRKTFRQIDHIEMISVPSIEEAARLAREHARGGDKVLFSPGFEAGGFDASRKERGERFVRAVRGF